MEGGKGGVPRPHAAQPLGDVEIQDESQIGQDPVGRAAIQQGDGLERHAAAVALIGDR